MNKMDTTTDDRPKRTRKMLAEDIPSVHQLVENGEFEEIPVEVATTNGHGRLRRRMRKLTPKEEALKKIAFKLSYFFAFLVGGYFILISTVYTLHDWVSLLIFSIVFIFPAYLSNAGMLVMGRRAKRPVDGGKLFFDGRPIFGPGKTWRGLLLGPLAFGIPIGVAVNSIFFLTWNDIAAFVSENFRLGLYAHFTSLDKIQPYFVSCAPGQSFVAGYLVMIIKVVGVSYGAAFGDLLGSFLKRRLNLGRGQPFWVVDQVDFVVLAVLLGLIPTYLWPELVFDPLILVFLFTLTPAIAVLANTVAYLFGWKSVPW
ncbi:MAG: hypothetical protein Kow0069_15680 [Promethearchaeota archaeon]